MNYMKRKRILSPKIRQSARGEACTVVSPLCSMNSETVVFAHISDGRKGMGTKSDDTCGVYACMNCHDLIDRRRNHEEFEQYRDHYILRAYQRTIRRLVELHLLIIKDYKHE